VQTGQVIAGRYRLLHRLGAGGMSVVWRAHDDVLDRDVAIKVLSGGPAADPELLHRIQLEARAAARLHHPHVVEVHDYGETEQKLPYVVMELVDGRSLADLLRDGALPWRTAVMACAQMAAALAAAHARGIVHRDVKPGNVMVTSDGVKLVDFGISATAGEADLIGGEVVGTPAYLAPERLGGGPVRPATDVYALGLTLYLALTGHLPWEASTTTQMLTAHVYREPPGLPPIAGLPPSVADLCARCLTKNPSDRPDAASVAAVLGEAAGIVPPSPLLPAAGARADAPPTVVLAAATAPRPWHRRRALLAGTVAALLALAGLATWFGTRAGTPAVQAMDQRPVSVPCTVTYAIRSALNGRYAAAVSVRNTGPVAVSPWRLTFALAGGQKLVGGSGWAQNGRSMQTGGDSLAAGASASSTFDATYQDSTPLPGQFALNGAVCEAQLSVDGQTVAPAAPVQAATDDRVTDDRSGNGSGGNSGSGNSASGSSGLATSGSSSSASGTSASGSSASGSSGSGSGSSGNNGNGNGKSKEKDKSKDKDKEAE
jgi:hypothetical protein